MYKLSLLFLYFRIFPVKSIRLGGYICGGVSTAWNLACIFAAAFQCTPRERLWMPWLEGTCINLFLTQLCVSIPSILCDIAILCLPIPHVWRLNTNLTQRLLLTCIFLLGSYVVFTSVYRFRVFLLYRTDDIPCKPLSLENQFSAYSRRYFGRWMCLEYCRDKQRYCFRMLADPWTACQIHFQIIIRYEGPHQRRRKWFTWKY